MMSNTSVDGPAGACTRCGECCEKGGPAFHLQDRHLIEKGIIHTRHLYTIRQGEPVIDNVQGRLGTAHDEIIKIKGKRPSWACVFFQKEYRSCAIYDQRPLECRLLKCWDTRDLKSAYEKDRLTRRDLLSKITGLWDLIRDHEKRCGQTTFHGAIRDLRGDAGQSAQETLLDAVRFDMTVRRRVVENGNAAPDMIDFLFGRPLTTLLKAYGYSVRTAGGRYRIVRMDGFDQGT